MVTREPETLMWEAEAKRRRVSWLCESSCLVSLFLGDAKDRYRHGKKDKEEECLCPSNELLREPP